MKIRALRSFAAIALTLISAPLLTSGSSVAAVNDSNWTLVLQDNFSGSNLDTAKWGVYTGGVRRQANVIVNNGQLTLRTRKTSDGWTAAGVTSARAMKQAYGRYEIRARLDRAQGTRAVALLWPTGGGWPPEVDFFEVDGVTKNRDKSVATNHFTPGNQMQHLLMRADFTQWQTIGVIWSPTSLRYYLNGNLVGTQSGQVPSREMWLGLQTAIGTGVGAPDATTPSQVDFDVDWVRVYRAA